MWTSVSQEHIQEVDTITDTLTAQYSGKKKQLVKAIKALEFHFWFVYSTILSCAVVFQLLKVMTHCCCFL